MARTRFQEVNAIGRVKSTGTERIGINPGHAQKSMRLNPGLNFGDPGFSVSPQEAPRLGDLVMVIEGDPALGEVQGTVERLPQLAGMGFRAGRGGSLGRLAGWEDWSSSSRFVYNLEGSAAGNAGTRSARPAAPKVTPRADDFVKAFAGYGVREV